MNSSRRIWISLVLLSGLFALCLGNPSGSRADNLYGSIRGTVIDPSGAAIVGATVTATNIATGTSQQITSGADGTYSFGQLVPGDYSLKVEKDGFQTYEVAKIHLDINTSFSQDAKMTLGAVGEQVVVEANPVQVETASTQLGSVVDSNQIENMPLIGRNWLQLQQLEPGVVSASDRFGTGSGGGNFATNGNETQFGSYLVDGTDTNDVDLNTQTFNLSPDAISEFREVTSTLNPEYARNSGVIVNAVTKSGTNGFHGDAFDFYRDTFLDSKNYFQQSPSPFHQNQFGATVGGPIIRNHTFFFFSYQGVRSAAPENVISTSIPVFTSDQRGGNFGAGAISSTNVSPFALWGSPTSTCPFLTTASSKCLAGTAYTSLFPTGVVPTQDYSSISSNLLSTYVPIANAASTPGGPLDTFQFNPTLVQSINQYLIKINQNIGNNDAIWGTWMQEAAPDSETIPFPGTGANVPGFGEVDNEHFKFLTLSWTHNLNSTMVNEARVGYNRFNFDAVEPQKATLPSTAGFSITPQDSASAGLPYMVVSGLFNLGFSQDSPQPRIDQTYQATDNFTWTKGQHTMKYGFDMRRWEVKNPFYFQNNGMFNFAGAGTFSTGNPGIDFLLGIPDSYSQGSGQTLNDRAREYYSYAQDSFRVRPDFTLIYGLGWTIDTPMIDIAYGGHAQFTFVPGQQSTVFPNAPVGVVYEGDNNVYPAGRTHLSDLGPRIGFAYAPDWGWLTGGAGRTSIRAGFGIYYDRSETEQAGQVSASSPPFAISSEGYGSVGTAGFANPFANITNSAQTVPNPFPFAGSSSSVNFATTPGYLPIWTSCCATASEDTRDPMVQNWNFTVQRQLTGSSILTLGYVGSKAHHLSVALPINIATNITPCLLDPDCNLVTQTNAAGPGTGGHPNDFLYPANIYGTIDTIFSKGRSSYNSLEASIDKKLSHNLQFIAAYTYAHSIDNGSGFENSGFAGSFGGFGGFAEARTSNPYCWPGCDVGSSTFDARHRLSISYFYQLPGLHGNWMLARLTNGWTIAGITTFQTGFPLDVTDSSEPSLGCQAHSDFVCWDGPNLVGPVKYLNPRTTGSWFDPSAFAQVAPYATPASASVVTLPNDYGNAPRNLMRGPGRNNWDFEVYKDTQISETVKFELRMEAYNLFNHTQFDPNGIITDINYGPAFGILTGAYAARDMQLALKLYF